jgi:uncharacterized membrane protein
VIRLLHEIFHFFGHAICHQLNDRSLHISGEFLSVCARDTGIYIGIFSTLLYLYLFKRKASITIPSIKVSFLLLLFLVPLLIDGFGSYMHLFESNNARRLVTGISFGYALPYFLYPLLSNKSLEKTSIPVIKHSKDMVIPLLLCSVLGGLVYWGGITYYLVDGMIIFSLIIWFSLLCSFLFTFSRLKHIKGILSISVAITFLSLLSVAHTWIYTFIN